MKKTVLIVVLCFIFVFLSACSLTKMEKIKEPDNVSRMRLVESIQGGNMQIFYDQYTNVMYMYNYRGGFSPIYNADGSLYLYGSPRSVG